MLSPLEARGSSVLIISVEFEGAADLPTSGQSSALSVEKMAGGTGICGRGAREVRTTKGSSSSSTTLDDEGCGFVSEVGFALSFWDKFSEEDEVEAIAVDRDVDVDGCGNAVIVDFWVDAFRAANSSFLLSQTLTGGGLCGEGCASGTGCGLAGEMLGAVESPFSILVSERVGRGGGGGGAAVEDTEVTEDVDGRRAEGDFAEELLVEDRLGARERGDG